jgi:hypothetical protein
MIMHFYIDGNIKFNMVCYGRKCLKKSYITEMIGPRHLHSAISRLCAYTDQTYINSGDRL